MASPYHLESFSQAERALLAPYVSNLDRPVFVLTGLPQVTCAALFARYSRSSKSLRRLLLDEFLREGAVGSGEGVDALAGSARAGELFSRVLAEYGDDSVAQLGGLHLACEQVSQPLAKAIEWGRLGAYLEQSTRYIPFTDKRDGAYRYWRDPVVLQSQHGAAYTAAMNGLFDTYCALLEPLQVHLGKVTPELSDAGARKRAIRALALDVARGLLPAGTVSNVGIFASGQALEQLVMRLRAHRLPEANSYAELIAAELRGAIPDFVSRLDRPDRGGRWVEYLTDVAATTRSHALAHAVVANGASGFTSTVKLVDWDRDGEERILGAALFEYSQVDVKTIQAHVDGLSETGKDDLWDDIVGDRGNRRHRPGRGFEHTQYTFEVTSDYGAFRDLQRHRMLTIQWQELGPSLGYEIPDEVRQAGLAEQWSSAVEAADAVHGQMSSDLPEQSQYLITLGHRIRYLIRMNAREAMHMLEIRTSPQAHPSYRVVCQEMHRQIAEVAGHRRLAAAMKFVGQDDVHLPRYQSEQTAKV